MPFSLFILRCSNQDENDNTPRFENASYSISVRENEQAFGGVWPPRPLLQVRASDPDEGDNGQVTYTLQGLPESTDGHRALELYPDGTLTLASALDFEERPSYSFHVLAFDNGKPEARTATAAVFVRVVDENDSPVRIFTCLQLSALSSSSPSPPIVFKN